jgi:alpha-glutamyl/putrescinyl thymine pyrophosphorylase clade 1
LQYFDGHGWFIGRVVVHDEEEDLYWIEYSDGDTEEIDAHELSEHLLPDRDEVPMVAAASEDAGNPVLGSSNLWSLVDPNKKSRFQVKGSRYSAVMAEFFLFCAERHNIWIRRNLGHDPPWTSNRVFQTHHWCNVFRELDRGTAFFHSVVVSLEFRSGITREQWLEEVLWLAYVYRLVNKVESFLETGFPKRTKESVQDYLSRCRDISEQRDVSLFTCAHQTPGFPTLLSFLNGSFRVWDSCVEALTAAESHEERIAALRLLPGVGSFQSWQVLCDLDESGCFPVSVTTTNVELGPGAEAGLRLIFPTEVRCKLDQQDLARRLVRDQMAVYGMLGVDFPVWNDRCMGLKEVEHALCEFSKYKRMESNKTTKARYYRSRGTMDCNKVCKRCHEVWCISCVGNASAVEHSSWICKNCSTHRHHKWE